MIEMQGRCVQPCGGGGEECRVDPSRKTKEVSGERFEPLSDE